MREWACWANVNRLTHNNKLALKLILQQAPIKIYFLGEMGLKYVVFISKSLSNTIRLIYILTVKFGRTLKPSYIPALYKLDTRINIDYEEFK